jgi:hypothetical protein
MNLICVDDFGNNVSVVSNTGAVKNVVLKVEVDAAFLADEQLQEIKHVATIGPAGI